MNNPYVYSKRSGLLPRTWTATEPGHRITVLAAVLPLSDSEAGTLPSVRLALVRFIHHQQRGVDGLHAGRAGERPHQPVVDALQVVRVHARQIADGIADDELVHTYYAPSLHKHTSN